MNFKGYVVTQMFVCTDLFLNNINLVSRFIIDLNATHAMLSIPFSNPWKLYVGHMNTRSFTFTKLNSKDCWTGTEKHLSRYLVPSLYVKR